MNKRENWIDLAKSIAIYAVVLGHVVTSQDARWVQQVTSVLVVFHVPLFFFISGYLHKNKEISFKVYVIKNLRSLIVPYIFFNLASASILWKLQSAETFWSGGHDFLLGYGHAFAGPAWFLMTLFMLKIIYFWLSKVSNAYLRWSVWFFIYLCSYPFEICFGITNAIKVLPFFMLGNEFRRLGLMDKYLSLNAYVRIAIPFVLLALVVIPSYPQFNLGWANHPTLNPWVAYTKIFLAVFMAIGFCMLFNTRGSKMIEEISRSTIVIMGLHMTIVQCLWAVIGHLPNFIGLLFVSPYISLTSFVLSMCCAVLLRKYTPYLVGNRS